MRVYTSASDPLDFCRRCRPTRGEARARYETLGPGPDGRGNCFGYDEDHPEYEPGDECETCKRQLTEND